MLKWWFRDEKLEFMYKRLLQKPLQYDHSFFLFGPRGTGKTSWIRSEIPNCLYLDLLDQNLYLTLLSNPHQLGELIPQNHEGWVVIDEVQKIPPLLDEVHRLIEGRKIKFVLTGSSARSLKKKGVNLLAGRAYSFKMYPLTVVELGADFQLGRSLKMGHLPSVWENPNEASLYLEAYISTYLKEEVMQEGLTRNLAAFVRFLQAASFSQGSVLNFSEIARETGIKWKVVESYFDILEDLLLGSKLYVFKKKAKRKTIAHSKFYYFDVGVYRHLRPFSRGDVETEINGHGLETLVFQELVAINHYFQMQYEIYFWRTVDQVEVDFVLYGPQGFFAIEVKLSGVIHPKDTQGLLSFQEEFPDAKLYLFYGGTQRLYIDQIEVVPVEEALRTLPSLLSGKA